jgi:rhodanese-related sulfurtransferase
MKEVSVDELQELIDNRADFQLIDVREVSEFEQANIKGELIPLQTLVNNIDKVSKEKQVIIMCRSGMRSANAISFLEGQGFDNLYNLAGGILDWKAEIDNSLDVH